MNKHKIPDRDFVSVKRPRKKQAVGPTKKASTLRIVKQNAETSPLLRIPAEVRGLIWRAAIGDRTIHIKHFDQKQLSSLQRHQTHPESTPAGGAFRHIQCTATITEDEAYETSKAPSPSVPGGDDPVCYVQTCKSRHSSCYSLGNGTLGKQIWLRLFEQVEYSIAERDRITMCSLLGVSRQIYEEGYRLFWLTTTFSFDDPYSLREFLGSLTLSQKRHLTNLHVMRRIDNEGMSSFRWGHYIKPNVLPLLQGLKTLHLCFEQRTRHRFDSQYQLLAHQDEAFIRNIFHPWSGLRTSPLANVTVVISDKRAHLQLNNLLADRCTVTEKNRVAEKIRESLTNKEAVARARQDIQGVRASKNESKRRRKARMMQTDAQQTPLAWDDLDDRYQVPAAIDNSFHQMNTHVDDKSNESFSRWIANTSDQQQEQQQNHVTQPDLSIPSIAELDHELNRCIAKFGELQQQQQRNHVTQPDLSMPSMAELDHELNRCIAKLGELQQKQQHEDALPPQLYLDTSGASYHVPIQAQQQDIARQPAHDTYHQHSLRNNHMQQKNPLDVHYQGARSTDVLLPSYAGPMDMYLVLGPGNQVLSQHQGAWRHTVEGTVSERFHPYPRPAGRQQARPALDEGHLDHGWFTNHGR